MKFKFQQRRKLGMEWINQFDVFFVNSANSLLKSAESFFTPVFKGYTRIYFSVHYASDIVGGLSVGFLCGALSFLIFWLLDKYILKKKGIQI